jgi:GDP-L-fucose synthase
MSFLKNKKVLVTGGSGMIGRQLVNLLIEKDAKVYVADLNEPLNMPENINFIKVDLKDFSSCKNICKGMDFVFNLVGIKTSPKICMEKPASIIGPMLQFNTNMLEAAMTSNIEWYLYTSSVGVYQPSPVLKEDDVEGTVPSRNDWFGGWAKRIGEMQIQAYEIQNQVSNCSIVRPANVYGPYDNFDINNAMVIPSLIRKAEENEILSVWGDGSPVRDFIYAKDVARGMIFAVENKISKPVNLGSGNGISIKEIAETVAVYFNKPIEWDITKPSGDPIRILDMTRANSYGFQVETNIQDGIKSTIEWYLANKNIIDLRYNVFTSRG